MTYWLFLDDIRDPPSDKWTVVRSYQEFCDTIEERGLPEIVTFDHDLADVHYQHLNENIPYDTFSEKTGYDCAKWLMEHCHVKDVDLPYWEVHSFNPVGKQNIIQLLRRYGDRRSGS